MNASLPTDPLGAHNRGVMDRLRAFPPLEEPPAGPPGTVADWYRRGWMSAHRALETGA